MEKINFEAGTIVTPAKVNEDKTITPAVWEGTTPLSPFILNKLQDNIENDQIEQNTVIDELKAKTIKCLQEVETPTPVSGDSIDLTDSAEAKINELKISGNSKQETREGYNILPNNVTTQNINGVDFTVNKDGTVLVNGTPTANAVLQLNTGITYSAGTYKLSGCPKGGSDFTYRFDLMNKANNNISVIDIGNGVEFTITEETTFIPRIRIQSGVTINNLLFEPMLVSDTSKTKYEQYGASPSSDYPSDNESCGDNINLYNKDTEIVGEAIISTGGTQALSNWTHGDYIAVNSNEIISVTCENKVNGQFMIAEYDNNKTFIKTSAYDFRYTTADNKYTITTSSTTKYIIAQYRNDLNMTNIMVVKGAKVKSYSPYYLQGCINEVICNKNILPYVEKVNYNMATGVDYYGITYMQKVKSNTAYVLSTIDKLTSGFQLREYDKEGNIIQTTAKILGTTFTTNSKTQYIKFRTNDIVSKITNPKFMLEESKTLSDYIEHKEQTYTIPTQQPFRARGDIRDTFIKKNNKCYERHDIYRKILDGTEDWNLYTSDNARRFGLSITENMPKLITTTSNGRFGKGLCSHFGTQMNYTTTDLILFIQTANPIWYIGITDFNSKWANVTALKEWLAEQYNAGTPVYVDYLLETPLDIECTEEQSTILFDIEQNAKTYDKVTHMYSTDKISSYKEITYKKDIETLFENTLIEGV